MFPDHWENATVTQSDSHTAYSCESQTEQLSNPAKPCAAQIAEIVEPNPQQIITAQFVGRLICDRHRTYRQVLPDQATGRPGTKQSGVPVPAG